MTKATAIPEVSFVNESKCRRIGTFSSIQTTRLDRREVDNSESCSEGRRVEREKSDLFKKIKTTHAKCPGSQNVNSSGNG